MKIDFEKIIYDTKTKAASLLDDDSRLRELLIKAKSLLEDNKELRSIVDDVKLLIQLVKDYTKGEYKDLTNSSIILVLVSLIYLVNPVDIIPDFLPGGFIDDAAVLTFILKKIQTELNIYKDWKSKVEDDVEYIEINIDDYEDNTEEKL